MLPLASFCCRNGNAPSPQLQDVMRKTCADAKTLIDRNLALQGTPMTAAMLQEKLDIIRGAVTMAFPMGLPENDSVRMLIEDKEDAFLEELMGNDYLDPNTATLWFGGKEFFRDQTVGDRCEPMTIARNCATVVIGGQLSPLRELLAFYARACVADDTSTPTIWSIAG